MNSQEVRESFNILKMGSQFPCLSCGWGLCRSEVYSAKIDGFKYRLSCINEECKNLEIYESLESFEDAYAKGINNEI